VSDAIETIVLDFASREAVRQNVAEARAQGWTSLEISNYFNGLGVDIVAYKAALKGDAVSPVVHGALAQVSITGLPGKRLAPSRADILRHLEWHVAPARGAYDDALLEIAFDTPSGLNRAELFELDALELAADFAIEHNLAGSNVYVGAALRTPDAPRNRRASDEHFYVGCSVPIDIDENYDETRALMAASVDDGAVVITGLVPTRRSQHWIRLTEPCDDLYEYGAAFTSLVHHTGADVAVKDAARVMRLAGTISYPNEKKKARGYCVELVSFSENPEAKSFSIEQLKALSPGNFTGRKWDGVRPEGHGIERDWTGRVTNGREMHFRDLLLRHLRTHQEDTGLDPSPLELFALAFEEFSDPAKVDNRDERWTCENGKAQLLARAHNTLRRLERGRLAGRGLFSRETLIGRDQAEAVQAQREERFQEKVDPPTQERLTEADPEFGDIFEYLSLEHLKALPDQQWVIEDVIPENGLGFIYGAPASGKSFIALNLALALSYGAREWLGKPIKARGGVLYLAAEGSAGMKNRIHAWQQRADVSSDDAPFHLIRSPMSFTSKDDIDRLVRTVEAIQFRTGPISIVFVDTVSRVLPGADENMQKDMTVFIAACDALRTSSGATVLGVHHTGKSGDMRGSTVLRGAGDCVFRVDRDEGTMAGILTCEKQKEAEDGWKRGFTLEKLEWMSGLKPISSLTVSFVGDAEPQAQKADKWPSTDTLRAILNEVNKAWVNDLPWSPHTRAKTEGRFAQENISRGFGIQFSVAEEIVFEWQRTGVLTFEMYDKKTKAKGLRVSQWPDWRGGNVSPLAETQ
jgi:hypothetical protein